MREQWVVALLAVVVAAEGRKREYYDFEDEEEIEVFPSQCLISNPFHLHADFINYVAPSRLVVNKWPGGSQPFATKTKCHFLENFYGQRIGAADILVPSPLVSSLPIIANTHTSVNGVPETVPIPCKPCDTDRKDRSFIRGQPYTSTMTKLLVDHASVSGGGKLVSHSEGIHGASDILVSDENKYMLTLCSSKVWLTVRLGEEVFVEKIGIGANELFASTFRHIQILGSRQYPTNEWRVLGEIETNPLENQEWFDVSASAQCSKCYVRFIKLRVLTHHALEGYTNCAMTRLQVFGSTVLQSLDKIQSMQNTTMDSQVRLPNFVKASVGSLMELMDNRLKQIGVDVDEGPTSGTETTTSSPIVTTPTPEQHHPTPSPADDNPLLKFIEEMTVLKKQYSSVANNVYSMNEMLKSHSAQLASNITYVPRSHNQTNTEERITVSVLGFQFVFPKSLEISTGVVAIGFGTIILFQTWLFIMLYSASRSTGQQDTCSRLKTLQRDVSRRYSHVKSFTAPRIKRLVSQKYSNLRELEAARATPVQTTGDEGPRVVAEPTQDSDAGLPPNPPIKSPLAQKEEPAVVHEPIQNSGAGLAPNLPITSSQKPNAEIIDGPYDAHC